ncbi:hypothetical protein E3U43_002094 [Larimichthys crocea]|uniref:Uncharacterized protein n=1 Tax=Larimichthys crocea TaxID=215358 RepID=A0ACD3QQI5_LARCR|nr:hypothetical protein E3U43_002094 [Larimichthys crocea]
MTVRALFTTSALLLQLLLAATSAADQSTCRGIWLFELPCTEPISALMNQVNDWSSDKCQDSQEKCMYEITKESSTYLEIKHTSRRSHKITLISFDLNPPAVPTFCKMRVVSTTTSPNEVTPNDYCLIYNLINGSGLTKARGYREICNKQMCPSKQSATCYNEE